MQSPPQHLLEISFLACSRRAYQCALVRGPSARCVEYFRRVWRWSLLMFGVNGITCARVDKLISKPETSEFRHSH